MFVVFLPCTAILGFTGLINQVQYHAAVMDKISSINSGGWNGMRFENVQEQSGFNC